MMLSTPRTISRNVSVTSAEAISNIAGELDSKHFGPPLDAELAGRRHVPEHRGRRDDGRAREVAFAAETHAILPVAIERRNGALSAVKGVFSLAEAGTAPRLPDHRTHAAQHVGDRITAEALVGPLDLLRDAAG